LATARGGGGAGARWTVWDDCWKWWRTRGGSPTYATNYTYDTLDRLTDVNQSGLSRHFVYDPLGRLTSATNPENGTVTYGYDNNGNLTSRAQGTVTVTMGYDDGNRLRTKSYNDGTTPAVSYTYDTDETIAGHSEPNTNAPLGRLTRVDTEGNTTVYRYDGMGRVTASRQSPSDVLSFIFGYGYNQAGGLEREQYPSGRVVTTCYNQAGWPLAVKNGEAGSADTYAGGVQYEAHGGLSQMTMGNGMVETRGYDADLRPNLITASGATSLQLGLSYEGNGNVTGQTITRPGFSATQSYGYDALNRILSVSEGPDYRNFGYSATGNMWVTTASEGWAPGSFTPRSAAWFDGNNRLVNTGLGVQHDAAGNQTAIGAYRYTYDGENRVVSSTVNAVTTTYAYDGEGRRVRKGSIVMVYDAFGRLAAEYGGTVSAAEAGRLYRTEDHLGSTRLVTDGSGNPRQCQDYLPFGEELPAGVGGRPSCYMPAGEPRHRFTGKERDQETGLDYFGARYYSGAQGRFTSPDAPFADQDPENPQSWNLYQYGYNNPLSNIDIDGRSVWTKAAKVIVKVAKTGNAAAAFADNVHDAATVLNPAASPLERIGAGLSLASELLPISVGDVKDAGRLLGVIDDVADAGKQVVKHGDDLKSVKGVEGIYEFQDATKAGKTYVGQSDNLGRRLGEHVTETGKLAPGSTVSVTPIPGGKTAREVAEQKRINQLGGTANRPGSQTSNQRNPIGEKRRKKLEEQYGSLNEP
jgi:RHS repeat-associated protein